MREYFVPNFRHKNTVYLKSNVQIYCIPKNPGRPWSLNFRVIWRLAWGFGLPGFKGQLLPQGVSLPSSCTASSQAYLVNVFRWRIRAKKMARTTWPEMHWPRGIMIMRPRDSARLLHIQQRARIVRIISWSAIVEQGPKVRWHLPCEQRVGAEHPRRFQEINQRGWRLSIERTHLSIYSLVVYKTWAKNIANFTAV